MSSKGKSLGTNRAWMVNSAHMQPGLGIQSMNVWGRCEAMSTRYAGHPSQID